jgi:phage-related tail protein
VAYSIGFDIFAKDRASATFDKLGRKVNETSGFFEKHKGAIIAGASAAGLAIVGFAKTSISAYADAEKSQRVLTDAYQRFPALADVPLQSLRDQAQALQNVTKFDGDATAAAMGHLAAFKLTGTQVQQLTPLLLDYAQKTGKDLPTAAGDLGKALLGQGRALKGIGINFKDTGSAAGNFAELTGALRTQVGGFAEKEGLSAEGRAAILGNKFDDLREAVGARLIPALSALANAGIASLDWMSQNEGKTKAIAAAVGGLVAVLVVAKTITLAGAAATAIHTAALVVWSGVSKAAAAAQWLLNAALTANPIGLVIAAIALLVAGLVIAYKRSETFRNIVNGALHAVAITAMWLWNSVFAPVIRFILTGFAKVTFAVAVLFRALGNVPGFGWAKTAADKMLGAAAAALRLAGNIRNIPTTKHVTITVSAHVLTGRIKVGNEYVNVGQFASGTRRAPPGWAWVGEKGAELMKLKGGEQIIPADESAAIASAKSAGGFAGSPGGTTMVININGPTIGTPSTIAQQIQAALLKLQREA